MRKINILKYLSFSLVLGLIAAVSFGAELKMYDPLTGTYHVPRVVGEYKGSDWVVPGAVANYTQGVIRTSGRNFIMKLELLDGVKFTSSVTPAAGFSSIAPYFGGANITTLQPAVVGGSSVDWLVTVTDSFSNFPTFQIAFSGVTVNVGSVISTGGTVYFQISTRDAMTGQVLEGPVQCGLMESSVSVALEVLKPGDKRIDVVGGRKQFWGSNPTQDSTNRFALDVEWNWRHDGTFLLSFPPGDRLILTVSGNLTRILSITFGSVIRVLTPEERGSTSVQLVLDGSQIMAAVGLWMNQPIHINLVPSDDPIDPRTLVLDARFDFGSVDYTDLDIVKSTALTKWSLNGTVLTAGYVNGNANDLYSRVYLKNESGIAGQMFAEVFTLPTPGTKSVSKGTVALGPIEPRGVAMLKVAEDILTPLGIPTSYPDNEQGNYALEVVLTVPDASGVVQTFRNDFTFGWGMFLMNKVTTQLTSITFRMPF